MSIVHPDPSLSWSAVDTSTDDQQPLPTVTNLPETILGMVRAAQERIETGEMPAYERARASLLLIAAKIALRDATAALLELSAKLARSGPRDTTIELDRIAAILGEEPQS